MNMLDSIICGDCREVIKTIPDSSVDLIIADPPYLAVLSEVWDKQEVIDSNFVSELFRVLKPTGSLYVWCGIGEKSQSLMRWYPLFREKFVFKDLITWKKQRGMGMRKGWTYVREEIMWFTKNKSDFKWILENQYGTERRKRDGGKDEIKPSQNGKYAKSLYKRLTNVWTDISETTFNVQQKIKHATPKPILAIERIIKAHTELGDVVLDPFLGSGTTAIASKRLGRNYIGIELNKEFCDLAQKQVDAVCKLC